MNIIPLLLEIGFIKWGENYQLARKYSTEDIELFIYGIDNSGVYNLILERTNFVPIRVEVKEENEKLVYDFISNYFGKEYVRDFKLKKIL